MSNELTVRQLSSDHKPELPIEKKRILEKGGIVEPFEDGHGNFLGPDRVWASKQDVPGLAMSRSLGDEVAHSAGVIPTPEIFEF